ncbi:hypothetical protein EVAR_96087_1 [Eumeta japonica]|uniref:Uncharacterized protein n=1 Tax=Eumeta variegata TaxID=151549 RepID=A0A4C1VDB5_EUMVA|nr:hypothetical protein EVAR_96087_1 [Eumeta japonica]
MVEPYCGDLGYSIKTVRFDLFDTFAEYGREVLAFAIGFHPARKSSGDPFPSPLPSTRCPTIIFHYTHHMRIRLHSTASRHAAVSCRPL